MVLTLRMEVTLVKLMDIEQAKQVVIPKKELGGRMKIPCKNCNQVEIWDFKSPYGTLHQEFSSAPEFNSHTIMCAKNLAQVKLALFFR